MEKRGGQVFGDPVDGRSCGPLDRLFLVRATGVTRVYGSSPRIVTFGRRNRARLAELRYAQRCVRP
jgi:hypothetical protein